MKNIEPKVIECPYWIVNTKEERQAVERLNGITWPALFGLQYPMVMGYEKGRRFQNKLDDMKDYYDKKENEIYTYTLKSL